MCSLEDGCSLYDSVSCSEKTLFLGNLRTGATESLVWLPVPVTPVLRMQRQEDHEFETCLDCRDPISRKQSKTKQRSKEERKEGEDAASLVG